jgi:hypothetical protein
MVFRKIERVLWLDPEKTVLTNDVPASKKNKGKGQCI